MVVVAGTATVVGASVVVTVVLKSIKREQSQRMFAIVGAMKPVELGEWDLPSWKLRRDKWFWLRCLL